MSADINREVAKVVNDTDLGKGTEAAYQSLKDDLQATKAVLKPADYATYVAKVTEELQKNGTIPQLSIHWADDILEATGKDGLSRRDLADKQEAASKNKSLSLDGAFAKVVQDSFEWLRVQNIDRVPGSKIEKDLVTSSDLEMAMRGRTLTAEAVTWCGDKLYSNAQTPEFIQFRQ